MKRSTHPQKGSTMLLTLGCLALLTISAAYTLQRISPRYRMTGQFAAWQEARLSAEAGVDIAFQDLQNNAVGYNDGSFAGWQQNGPNGLVPASPNTLRQFTAGGPLNLDMSMGNGLIGKLAVSLGLATLTGNGNGFGKIGKALKNGSLVGAPNPAIPAGSGPSVIVSDPIFLDNFQGASPGNRPTNTDVQMWAIYPTPSPYYRWFRIRAMATCAIPVVATTSSPDRLDNALRRYSLHTIRPQLRKDDIGTPMTVPTPSTSRAIEVLVEPLLPFELAIVTQYSLSLGTSGNWLVDSYDSRDPNKSEAGGVYPGIGSPKTQGNAAIASNAVRPVDALYGPLIALNGSTVRGTIATNGGDDPSTELHENVSGATKIDPAQVRDDFYRNLTLFSRPTTGIFMPPPAPGQPFIAGTISQPTQYLITKNLQAFTVVPETTTTEPGAVVIAVDGDLDVPVGTISIPPNVAATIYLRGNVDFHDRPINAGGQPQQLQIYGEDSQGSPRALKAFGQANITAAFYGPQYDVSLMDNVTWCGAVAARSFQMLGGGSGGFHYDESLGMVGAPIGFRIARYIEDVRE